MNDVSKTTADELVGCGPCEVCTEVSWPDCLQANACADERSRSSERSTMNDAPQTTIWQSMSSLPPNMHAGQTLRLKGRWENGKRYEREGSWDASEGIWVECMEGPDANALSSYPDDASSYGPTHWRFPTKAEDERERKRSERNFL